MEKNYKKGMIAGNFDVIHPGYIKMFNQCKTHCHELVIFLHVDPSIERAQKLQPILSLQERIEILHSLRMVDRVVPYVLEKDLINAIIREQPDVRFLGDDYIGIASYTGDQLGIPIHYLDRSHGWSTTKFKKLIAESVKLKEERECQVRDN